jgi:hypothetical protein
MRPSALAGRLCGPRVFANGLPRAGRRLLRAALLHFPRLHEAAGGRLGDPALQLDESAEACLTRLRRGQFLSGCLIAEARLLELVAARQLQVIVLLRDPRDMMVSWASRLPHTAGASAHRFDALSMQERLHALLEGVEGVVPPVGRLLDGFLPWMACDRAHLVRFEHLVGARGGASNGLRNAAIEQMLEFLRLPAHRPLVRRIGERLASPDVRRLYSRGSVGRWKQHFDADLVSAFEAHAGSAARRLGYD